MNFTVMEAFVQVDNVKNVQNEKPAVIVRSWGDKPVKMLLYRIENKRCYVGSAGAVRPIGLPFDQVFRFDVDRFSSLSTAFEHRDIGKLGELWANIPVDDLACNRYRNVLESPHDQENIANPECATSGNAQ